jgi:hypothetical protein
MDNTGSSFLPWAFLRDEKQPWPFGFNPETASSRARLVWGILTPEIQLAISKHNPFIKLRDEAIFELFRRGVPGKILAELSGLSKANCYRRAIKWQNEHH